MQSNVVSIAEARPQQNDYADLINGATVDFQAHLASELPALVDSLANIQNGKGEITFKISLGWNKDDEIEYQATGGHKHPVKVLSERRGETTKRQLRLW